LFADEFLFFLLDLDVDSLEHLLDLGLVTLDDGTAHLDDRVHDKFNKSSL
jgi:hypothetical protein